MKDDPYVILNTSEGELAKITNPDNNDGDDYYVDY